MVRRSAHCPRHGVEAVPYGKMPGHAKCLSQLPPTADPRKEKQMKRIKTALFTALGLALLAGALSLTYQKGVEAQLGSTPVRVVNTALAPALARDVDRRVPYLEERDDLPPPQVGGPVELDFPIVPAGKRLVIEY